MVILKLGIFSRREFNYVSDICKDFLSSIKLKNNGQVINIEMDMMYQLKT